MNTVKVIIAIWAAAVVIAIMFGDVTIAAQPGSTTANFLKIGVGARAAGMGGAFTAIADNPSAVYWNSAGLRRIDCPQAEFSHQSWYQDVTIENLQVVFPRQKISFGAGLTYLNYGDFQAYDVSGNPDGELSMYNLALILSAAADLTDNFSVGLSGKYIEQSFDVVKGHAFAADIGVMAGYKSIQIGLAAVNLGTKITYIARKEALPSGIRLGLAVRHFDDKALISFEGHAPFAGRLSLHQGIEFKIIDQLSARTGLIYQTGAISGDNALGWNLGVGLNYGKGRFDYSIIPSEGYGTDAIHNFSISMRW
jgi:Uncharacterised protein family (UPF0164)